MTDSGGLLGYQRGHLKRLAHNLKAVARIGRSGITDELVDEISRALEDHELIKVSMTRPPDKKAMAAELARRTQAHLCAIRGHTAILYRPRSEKPTIRLPERPESD